MCLRKFNELKVVGVHESAPRFYLNKNQGGLESEKI